MNMADMTMYVKRNSKCNLGISRGPLTVVQRQNGDGIQSHTVGRGSKGCEAPFDRWDGSKEGQCEGPLHGLDEIVSKKWSWVHRG
jgi:hypothetical protein